MRISILMFLFLLLVLPVANAQTLDVSCQNVNTTHGFYQEIVRNGTNIINNNSFRCPGLCATNNLTCNYPIGGETFFGIVFALIALAAIYVLISLRLPEDDRFLRLMLFFFGLAFLIILAQIITFSNDITMNQTTNTMVTVLYLVLLSFFISFIYVLLKFIFHVFEPKSIQDIQEE